MESAKAVDTNAYLIVLLGGDAGFRCGEMIALEWTDVDFSKRMLHVKRSDWRGHVTVPKGGRQPPLEKAGLPTVARRTKRICRAEVGAEGGIRSDHFSNKLMAHDFRR